MAGIFARRLAVASRFSIPVKAPKRQKKEGQG